MRSRIARYHNIFGQFGTWQGGKEKAPTATCRKVAMAPDGGEIEIWDDGCQTRSFHYQECVEGTIRNGGDNVLEGGAGNNTLIGDAGVNLLSFRGATKAVTVDMSKWTGLPPFAQANPYNLDASGNWGSGLARPQMKAAALLLPSQPADGVASRKVASGEGRGDLNCSGVFSSASRADTSGGSRHSA